jgi:hypothetical protein
MILRILKSNRPVNYFLVVILGVLFWAKSLINPQEYPFFPGENENILFDPIFTLLHPFPLAGIVTALVLTILTALLILNINGRYAFIRIRTMLPASLFVLMAGGFTEIHTLHPVYFATLFMLVSIHRLFNAFDKVSPFSSTFDAGFWLGVGSLFYLNLILLLPAFLLGVAILGRDNRWRVFVVTLIGFLLPFFFALSFAALTEQLLELLNVFKQNLLTANNHFKTNLSLQIFLGFLVLLTILSSIKLIQQYDTKKVSSRKYFSVFFLIFIFSLTGFVFFPPVSQEMLVITLIPVTFLASNFLVFIKGRFWGELIITLLFGIVIVMQLVKF